MESIANARTVSKNDSKTCLGNQSKNEVIVSTRTAITYDVGNTLYQCVGKIYSFTHFIPCCISEFILVLQMMRSAHCTMTMLIKKAV